MSSEHNNYTPSHNEKLTFSNTMTTIKSQINEVNLKLTNLIKNIDSDKMEIKYGLSYFESKQNMFIMYLTELISYLISKTNASKSIDDSPIVRNLLNLKGLIEKTKIIDMKLKPQIDRLLQLAENEGGEHEANLKPRLLDENEKENDEGNEEIDEEEIEKKKKQLKYEVNKNMIEFFETKDEKKSRKKQIEKDKEKIRNSETLKALREEMTDAPKVVNSYDTHYEKYKKEIEKYEDEHFVNLRISKRDKKRLLRKDKYEDDLTNMDKEFSQIKNILNTDKEEEEERREERNKFIQRKRELKKMDSNFKNQKNKKFKKSK